MIFEALSQMDENLFAKSDIQHDEDDAYQAYKNYKMVMQGLNTFYE